LPGSDSCPQNQKVSVAGSPIGHLQVLSVNSIREIFFDFISTLSRFFMVSSLKSETTSRVLSLESFETPDGLLGLSSSLIFSLKSVGSLDFCGLPLFFGS
jgi:hypothetical protein